MFNSTQKSFSRAQVRFRSFCFKGQSFTFPKFRQKNFETVNFGNGKLACVFHTSPFQTSTQLTVTSTATTTIRIIG